MYKSGEGKGKIIIDHDKPPIGNSHPIDISDRGYTIEPDHSLDCPSGVPKCPVLYGHKVSPIVQKSRKEADPKQAKKSTLFPSGNKL